MSLDERDETRDGELVEDEAAAIGKPEVRNINEARNGELDLQDLSREQLENELEVARAEIERLQDQSLRRQAELINFRRRAQKELSEATAAGQARLLEGLVPVVDDFERAVGAEAADVRAYHEGMQLTLRSLQKVLDQIGVERIEPHGEPFDPRFHEAIARHQTDEAPEGHILDVYQPGYKLGDRLIRPAAVVVAFGGGAGADVSAEETPADGDDAPLADEGDPSDA